VAISVESDRAHKAFAESLDLTFPLLSDFNRQVVKQFGIDYTEDAPYSGFWGMSRRSVFVLDNNGVMRYVWLTDDPLVEPDYDAVLDAVDGLQSTVGSQGSVGDGQ